MRRCIVFLPFGLGIQRREPREETTDGYYRAALMADERQFRSQMFCEREGAKLIAPVRTYSFGLIKKWPCSAAIGLVCSSCQASARTLQTRQPCLVISARA